jgi:hypothetical protein
MDHQKSSRNVATRLLRQAFAMLAISAAGAAGAQEPLRVLFVGNSFTYGRAPVVQYNNANVVDLNAQNADDKPLGSDAITPNPWGGVPGIFKTMVDQARLGTDVQLSLRGGATLRGHLLNTNPAGWDMRANLASARWDVVVLQGNSTEAVDRAGGNFCQFSAYVGKLKRFLTVGDLHSYRDSQLCPGGSTALRTIPANANANSQARVYLYQTWARPDMTYPVGQPYSGEPLETMTADLRAAYLQAAVNNGGIAGIVPVGDAFLRAVQEGFAVRDPYVGDPSLIDLWWDEDRFHPGTHGSYLSALMMFGAITGIDPASFGATEKAAGDLGISPLHAMQLQGVASRALAASGLGLESKPCLHANPVSRGAAACTRD